MKITSTTTTTFDQIHNEFSGKKTFSKGKDVSLRMEGTSLHIHKTGKGLSGTGKDAANARMGKKAEARATVEDTLNKKLQAAGLERTAGTKMLEKLTADGLISGDRITARDLSVIKNAADQAIQKEPLGELRAELNATMEQAGLAPNAGMKLLKRLIDNKQVDAGRLAQGNIKDLGVVMVAMNKAIENLDNRKQVWTPKTARADSPQAGQLLQQKNTAGKNNMAAFARSGIDGFHGNNVSWSVSDGGAGGVVFVTKADQNQSKAVLKFDGGNTDISIATYGVLDGLRQNVTEPLPFNIPNMTVIDVSTDQGTKDQLLNKLTSANQSLLQQANDATDDTVKEKLTIKAEKISGNLGGGMISNLTNDGRVCKFEMIENAEQLNKMQPDDKQALLRSEQFATNLGKSMVIMQFLGLNDHLNIGAEGKNQTNFSNLMVDPHGNIHMIDPSMRNHPQQNGSILYGVPTQELSKKLTDCVNFLTTAGNNPDEALKMIESALIETRKGQPNYKLPFTNLLLGVFQNAASESGVMFYRDGNRNEIAEHDMISDATKNHFAAAMMKGVVEGLEFLDRNRQTLTQVTNTGSMVYDGGQVLGDLHTSLTGLDVTQVKSNLDVVIQQEKAKL